MARARRNTTTTTPTPTPDAVAVDTTPTPGSVAIDVTPTPDPEPPATVEPTTPATVDGVPTTVDAYRAAVVATITDESARAELLTPGAVAIAAGLMAVRATVANPDAIRAAVGPFIDAARSVHPAIDDRDNVARWTARNITTGQNVVYAIAKIVRVCDAAIAVGWVAVWPGAKCDYADKHRYIASTRTDVNNARHGWTRDDVTRYGGSFGRFTPNGTAF